MAVGELLLPGRLYLGQAAVGGVHQGGALGNGNLYCQRTGEQPAVDADLGSCQPVLGKRRCGVGGTGGGVGRPSPLVAAVTLACVGGAADGLGIGLGGHDVAVTVAEGDGAAVAVELEAALVGPDVVRAQPQHLEALGGHTAYAVGYLPLVAVGVAERHTTQVDGLLAGVVQLYPAVKVDSGAHG